MRPLRYAINVTLDGCCHHQAGLAPDEESMDYWTAEVARADALLFGRVTYEPSGLRAADDIVGLISEVVGMEQILIRNLPPGTKAALRARAARHSRSLEAEARGILAEAVAREPVTMVDLLGSDEGADIEFEPARLGLGARTPEL